MTFLLPFNPLPAFALLHGLLLLVTIIQLLRSKQSTGSRIFSLLVALTLPVIGSLIILVNAATERKKLRAGLQ